MPAIYPSERPCMWAGKLCEVCMMSEEQPENEINAAEDETLEAGGESFAKLFEESEARASTKLRPGQRITARVISVSGDHIYIDLGGKTEGIVYTSEFTDEDGTVKVAAGDEVSVSFVTRSEGSMRFTTMVHGYSAVKLSGIRDAFDGAIPVNGEVKREVKGGFEVMVGGVRCFCPFSLIDLKGGREGGVILGQTFPFKVIEFKEDGKNIVLSRRAVLEEEKKAKVDELKASLNVGDVVTGTVRSVQNFGAFVELFGTVDALIPVSEMAWGRISKPKDVIEAGQTVTARVIALDWTKGRLTLSLKAMQADPWDGIADRYPVESTVRGIIVRLETFGAFVSLEPGIDGLIHISNLGAGRRINHPKEVVEVGQEVEAFVLGVDPDKKKLSLSLDRKVKAEDIPLPKVGEVLNGKVERVMPYGLFIRLESGISGLAPNAEMGTPRGSDHAKMFPAGCDIQTMVIEVDQEHKRVRLSRKAIAAQSEKEDVSRYMSTVSESKESSMGSLGELLKAKMDEKNVPA